MADLNFTETTSPTLNFKVVGFETAASGGELTAKLTNLPFVKTTGDQSVTGVKTFNALAFNTAAGLSADAAGKAVWNATDKTFDVNLDGTVVMQVGQETLMRCRNATGSTIQNGSVVYVSGATGNRPTIALADADLSSAAKTIGIVTEDIANNADGFITLNGTVHGLNTAGFAAGDTLYLSSTAGLLTNVAPTKPARQVTIGTCTVSNASVGQVEVCLNKFPVLAELSDVSTASLANGDVLVYNSSTSIWENKTLANAGIASVSSVEEVRTTIAQNSKSADYTLVLDDKGKMIFHPSADTTARTFTIPANSSVAYPVGTAITFVCQNGAGNVTIAITSDTMRLAGAGTTGSRTLAANGVATALKLTTTEWLHLDIASLAEMKLLTTE